MLKILLIRILAVLMIANFVLAACTQPTPDPAEVLDEFCKIAKTSSESRNEEEINEYYKQLEAVAPEEIKNDITTLREGWKQIEFGILGGNASRPEEISEAGQNVAEFVNEKCGFRGGVYLVMPEIGW
jgi:hypothetical protein